ncbi:hypothetical protein [Myxococcus eversor]|uniref:hypothetical protein n=1 Tax=Myxococcus eversor TaxID=2709661 RepID=UPI0013D2B87E|nr:hypothetical protein [Myxococcus eversor]
MSRRNDDRSGNGTEQTGRTGAMQPRVARAKQVRKLREKSSLALPAVVVSTQGGEAKTPKQGRLRQLKATKQLAAKLTGLQGGGSENNKVSLAKPMQLRQFSARKSFKLARSATLTGAGGVLGKQGLARTAQVRQFGAKKQAARKAETA